MDEERNKVPNATKNEREREAEGHKLVRERERDERKVQIPREVKCDSEDEAEMERCI